jgi:hypothetical protein
VIAHLEELLAMCDIEIGDRRAVHEQNDLLGPRRERHCCSDREYEESGGKAAASIPKLDGRNHEFLSITQPANGTASLVSRSVAQGRTDPLSLQQAKFSTYLTNQSST